MINLQNSGTAVKHCHVSPNALHSPQQSSCSYVLMKIFLPIFSVQTAIRICISIVKPTRCTNFSNLFYFGITLYMFRTVFPSIIRSSRLYIQQQVYTHMSNRCQQAGNRIRLTYTCCCMYSLELLMMDGKTVRNMQSVIPK